MTSDSNYAVRPPSNQGEVSNLPAVSQTADRLPGRAPRQNARKGERRSARPGQPQAGPPAPPAPGPGAKPDNEPQADADEDGDDEGHVDCYI